jgi:RNA polymerase sigma-70 factor (ECF subfamily)
MQVPNEEYHLQRVRKGDHQAYAILVEYYKDLVFTICKRITQNDEDAEECAQDTFVKAFRYLDSFKGEAKFSTWLFRIAYNTAISKQRRQRHEFHSTDERQVMNLSFEDTESGYRTLGAEQRRQYLQQAIARLSPEDANLVTLFYYNELSMAEIQEVTGIELSNIKVKLHRARKKLHEHLQSLLKDELEEIL